MTVAIFGFGLRGNGAYRYLAIDGERLEVKVTPALGPVLSAANFDNGFITFSCAMRAEEYGDFHEVAEVAGCLEKWELTIRGVTDVKILDKKQSPTGLIGNEFL